MSVSVSELSKARHIVGKQSDSAVPADVRYLVISATRIPNAVRWSFLLFAATIPFDFADLTFMDGNLSPAKISGYLFFVFCLFYYGPLSRKRSFPRPPHAMWWFLGYVVVYALNGFLLREELLDQFFTVFFTLLQLVFFFWIASDLLKDQKMATNVLLTYSIASGMLAVGIIVGMPGLSVETAGGRTTALSDNPNDVGSLMAISAVMLLGLTRRTSLSDFLRYALLPLMTLPVLVVMVNTGSRGAIIAFVVGCSVYLLPYWRSKRRLIPISLAILGALAVVYLSIGNPDVLERWQRTYYEGHLANREQIFSAAMEMILEQPIFGWQPVELFHELGFRIGFRMSDAHNLYLHLLLEVGMVGAFPFLVGLALCGRAAWKGRGGDFGVLPLAVILTLLTENMSGTFLRSKLLWLSLALALASASRVTGGSGSGQQVFVRLMGRRLRTGDQDPLQGHRLSPT